MNAKSVFKNKAIELATKLQTLFPTQLLFVVPSLHKLDEGEMFSNYITHVHSMYAERIRCRDDAFFMTTSDIDDPMNVVHVLRGLWKELGKSDREVVWKYMDMFERLVKCS